MPRGVPKVQKMSEEELDAIEMPQQVITPVVGKINGGKALLDKQVLESNKRVFAPKDGWIKMTDEEAVEYCKKGLLVGHDPDMQMGLLKK